MLTDQNGLALRNSSEYGSLVIFQQHDCGVIFRAGLGLGHWLLLIQLLLWVSTTQSYWATPGHTCQTGPKCLFLGSPVIFQMSKVAKQGTWVWFVFTSHRQCLGTVMGNLKEHYRENILPDFLLLLSHWHLQWKKMKQFHFWGYL